ncbi:MAG: haloacid dehalogenase type II [Flavisolibacter sp.]|nr:haloacid dehalogenase type II [Flavisolibacter sp.]
MANESTLKTNAGQSVSPKVILFDVYETLLNLNEVKAKINRLLGSRRGYPFWYNMLLYHFMLDNSIDQYHDFETLVRLTLDMAAQAMGEQIDEESKEDIIRLFKHLPVHEDVQKGLSLLRDHGYRLATLTNVSSAITHERMQRTGLISYFDAVFTVSTIKKTKPAIETYQWAAQTLNVHIGEVLMVTAHAWDIAGALHAGMLAVFVERNNEVLHPLLPQPTLRVDNLLILTKQLLSPTKE